MAKKVSVNANYEPVAAGSADAAFIFDADDERLEKYRARAVAEIKNGNRQAVVTSVAVEDDGTVERVGTSRKHT